MGISQRHGADYRNPMHVGKEYTLCRVITIRIAVSAVKDDSWEGSSVRPGVGLRRKIIKLSIKYFAGLLLSSLMLSGIFLIS